jgi:hypothetical protein
MDSKLDFIQRTVVKMCNIPHRIGTPGLSPRLSAYRPKSARLGRCCQKRPLTSASVSEKVGKGLTYQAACRSGILACLVCVWASNVTNEKKPNKSGVVRAIARFDHWAVRFANPGRCAVRSPPLVSDASDRVDGFCVVAPCFLLQAVIGWRNCATGPGLVYIRASIGGKHSGAYAWYTYVRL